MLSHEGAETKNLAASAKQDVNVILNQILFMHFFWINFSYSFKQSIKIS